MDVSDAERMTSIAGPTDAREAAEYNVREVARALRMTHRTPVPIVCATLHISQATWFHKIKGDSAFTVGEVADMARLWGVRVGDFFEGRVTLPDHRGGGPANPNITPNIAPNNAWFSADNPRLGGLLRGGSSNGLGRPAVRHLRLAWSAPELPAVEHVSSPDNGSVSESQSAAVVRSARLA